MTKPDWAERLQRTFSRKFLEGYNVGFDHGKRLGAATEALRILNALQTHGSTGDNLEIPWKTVEQILLAEEEKKN